jgi:ferredoxin-NADP reductase
MASQMYTVNLLKKEDVAEGTTSFYFEKPQGFTYIAGQYINLRLINPSETDDEGTRRFFSLTSAPFEQDLRIATRMRDTAFKRILKNMELGSEIELFGPYGKLVLHEDLSIPAVFLTGGIGVTPFRSMVAQSTHDKSPHVLYMFYSNRRPEDTVFLSQLLSWQDENPNFKLIATMTDMTNSTQSWEGEQGIINIEMIKKYLEDLTKPIYYIAGPPGMVEAMNKMLLENGIPEEKINKEDFTGY